VSKLSEYKKEAVRQTGFGGLLDLPLISKVNLKLSAWLLTKLDTQDSCLVFSESKRIYLHEKDIGKVFGIPCGDLDVCSSGISPEQIVELRCSLGLNPRDPRRSKHLDHVLKKHFVTP
jgi:hypothetical protein